MMPRAVGLLKAADPNSKVVSGAASVMDKALNANATANPILTATLPPVIQAAFTVNGALLNTGHAHQLRQVSRLIDARATTGAKRQFFSLREEHEGLSARDRIGVTACERKGRGEQQHRNAFHGEK